MALAASPVGESTDGSCALALATDGGIAVWSSPSSAASALASADGFSATLPDLRWAYFLRWREPCLAYLSSATGASAVSGVAPAAVLFAPAAACDGPAKHTKSPVASIKAERPLALIIIGNLPICPAPAAK